MSPSKLRVGVIFGGRSGEHEVSLVSASAVIEALDKKKFDVVPIGITREGRWISSPRALAMLKDRGDLDSAPGCVLIPEPKHEGLMMLSTGASSENGLDVVIPLVHGTYGEDGTLQGLLELADIPYVGAGVLGSALGMDKIVQKQVFAAAGLRTARYDWRLSSVCRDEPRKVAQGDREKTPVSGLREAGKYRLKRGDHKSAFADRVDQRHGSGCVIRSQGDF